MTINFNAVAGDISPMFDTCNDEAVEWLLRQTKKDGVTTAYKYTDVQSGSVFYSMREPEAYEREQFWVVEESLDTISKHFLLGMVQDYIVFG